ncbi:DNA-binding GntR family transcriptional regulator [Bosea sp. BE125]|uniref:GntR family transcriptional regulator n=1 Tax=Bosea sp. BE125 TaxID=2817909 RepID=UPI00285473A8|nr:GntR family transcriptional regulator [Bosea sp. BE125]MDR6873236.1 DNA-binding GntR family transcriptional regulator [Bosea sp. BE125]
MPPRRAAAVGLKPTAPTRTETLRLQIADEIVSGALEPGTPLDEQELAARFGVSRTPVREAIRQLSSSGLVSVRPHRGAVVALPTPSQLHDMFEVMAELEGLCAGLAARNMTVPERRGLEALHQALRTLVHEGDPARYHETNEAFHAAIYAGTHNGYLAELTLMTRARVAPFRRAQFRATGRLGGSYQEHDTIVQAILRGDQAGATEAMRAHIGIVRDAFSSYAEAR